MIVFANRPREADTTELTDAVSRALGRLCDGERPEHEQAIDLLVACGELETAVADAAAPERDAETPLTRALRDAMHAIGSLVHATWLGTEERARRRRDEVRSALAGLDPAGLPPRVRPRVPEGYVFYSLRPEIYLEAARRFAEEVRPRRAVCLGLRSIGTSLSALVAATLAESGCLVASWTLRPRGHPFARELRLSSALERELREAAQDAFVLVVDEGPGLSGSSFTGAARRLIELGVPEERVVLFPSWQPDPERFVSPEARRRWPRHRSYVVSFEDVWVHSGRLARAFSSLELRDVSAGRWRSVLYADPADHPAVHPQHERRKYLSLSLESGTPRLELLKFCGLGEYGRAAQTRMERLFRTGFAPRPGARRHGFVAMDFVHGRPLAACDVCPRLLDTIVRYLAFRAANEDRPGAVPFDSLIEMMQENVAEGLGPEWREALGALELCRAAVRSGHTIAVDGRMLPHEWLAAGDAYLKTDGVDHHDDHSFPGHQDVAWDVIGTIVEFDLDPAAERWFVDSCSGRLGDPLLPRRLPFYRAAYLGYRLGYCTLAAQSLASPDGERFRQLCERYAAALRTTLAGARRAA